MTLLFPDAVLPPAGNAARFGARWRLVGAGLSNVWRYADLELPAPSGRLLLRGPNGTGKTTALEVLWPYLLDLNSALLAAGKARNTHLSGLMKEGTDGRRRVGYLWISFAGPGDDQPTISYGVRLNFSEGSTPPVKPTPFTVPGRPLHELRLWGPNRDTLRLEDFSDAVTAAGGTVFASEDDYVRDLASRIFATEAREIAQLAARIRQVRNPAHLGEVSPRAAADALRESLPGVPEDDIEAAGEALAESKATREAFEQDRLAAVKLAEFARVWTGHVVDVASTLTDAAAESADTLRRLTRDHDRLAVEHERAVAAAGEAGAKKTRLTIEQSEMRRRLAAIEATEEYRAAGRLAQLAIDVDRLSAAADSQWDSLKRAAAGAAAATRDDIRNASDLVEDTRAALDEVAVWEPAAAAAAPLAWSTQPRPILTVGDQVADPGPRLEVSFDAEVLDYTIAALTARADLMTREADQAKVFSAAHEVVLAAQRTAEAARSESSRLATTADEKAVFVKERTVAARAESADLGARIGEWLAADGADVEWSADDLGAVDWSDPSAAVQAAERFAQDTGRWAHERAAVARADAAQLDGEAEGLRTEARDRRAEAAQLRDDGALLPLPRPDWAGPGDDSVALAAVIDWAAHVDADVQDRVEATMAAAGLLGATLTSAGASTATWAVDATGPQVEANLESLLRPIDGHAMAAAAGAVLARVGLAGTALAGDAAVTVGLDGTFRAGVLVASVPDATDPVRRRPARHIGAHRRRAAALSRADELDAEAAVLDDSADSLVARAEGRRAAAAATLDVLAQFPKQDRLRDLESGRVAASEAAAAANEAAAAAEAHAVELEAGALAEQERWTTMVTAAGLPANVDELNALVTAARRSVDTLRHTSQTLDGRLRRRFRFLVETAAGHDSTSELDELLRRASTARSEAAALAAELDELRAETGRTAAASVERHGLIAARLGQLGDEVTAAADQAQEAAVKSGRLDVEVQAAAAKVVEAGPVAAAHLGALRALLDLPGVAAVALGDTPDPDDGRLVRQCAKALAGRPTAARRSVTNFRDETNAALAGLWSIDLGAEHPLLDTYLVTHGNDAFGPVDAAAHAATVAERAEKALRDADEAALHDFVIGRLPAAISHAWTRLFDWSDEVNSKMRAAASSSGVGVAVKITVRQDLSPAARIVYERACKAKDAVRDPAAKAAAGKALHQLINAADDDDMTARVRSAVNIRDWVDVTYQVTRPGEAPRNWGPRTGLSGGERRLVVLAPMLAAVAAAFDKFPAHAARLAALDEVPSEVDEEGREGLARYIAELDLDLVATSHHWDGAPGAWDGIDAFDLEAASDGTVVAFPILIRGALPLPGDTLDG